MILQRRTFLIGAGALAASPALAAPGVVPRMMTDYVSYSPDQIYDFNIPWNINLSYRFNVSRGNYLNPDTLITVQAISQRIKTGSLNAFTDPLAPARQGRQLVRRRDISRG